MPLKLELLMQSLSHLSSQDLSCLVTFLDSCAEHQILLSHLVVLILEDQNLALFAVHLLRLEVHLELQFLHLFDDLLLCIRSSRVLSVGLPLFILDFGTQLFNQLVILQDESFLLPVVFLKALSLALVQLVEFLCATSLLIGLILGGREFVFKVLDGLSHVALSRLHLALIDLSLFGNLLFLNALSLVDLSDELFFFKGKLLALKLDHFEFLFVLSAKLSELEFSLAELV